MIFLFLASCFTFGIVSCYVLGRRTQLVNKSTALTCDAISKHNKYCVNYNNDLLVSRFLLHFWHSLLLCSRQANSARQRY